jgi:hypothetical protein
MKTTSVPYYWSPPRAPVISTVRSLNTTIDRIFYNTDCLSVEEQVQFERHATPEGFIVLTYPRASRTKPRVLHTWEFVKEQKASTKPIDTIAVAGVGSSALGTASLCRDAANYLGRPVAGIVSGLGLSDVMTEALGGWFVFGLRNALRDWLARTLRIWGVEDKVRSQQTHDKMKAHFESLGADPDFFIYGSPDSTALLYILSTLGRKIKLLIGHSKGNLCIENALEGLEQLAQTSGKPVQSKPEIVTLGAVTWFGPEFQRHLHQFLGQIDSLGYLNSRWDVEHVDVPWAWHSLNLALPGHMSVADTLRQAGIH